MAIDKPLSITGLGALSASGNDVKSHHRAVMEKHAPFRSLGALLGNDSPHAQRPAAWIEDRFLLTHRKWSPATMAALHAARQAVADAGWTHGELTDSALVVGTSRGNAAGWLAPWPGRRPFKLMASSNTIHSEPASAISIDLGITGPNHVIASGCAAGLDAIGIAMMLVRCGAAPRALAVAVDLPLVPMLLDGYASSGILSRHHQLDPYAPETSGFIPAEAAAAMAIEPTDATHPQLTFHATNSDACAPGGIPRDGGHTPALFAKCAALPTAVCPHATGTAVQAAADPAALARVFPEAKPTLHLLKPFLGHAIGASGMLETVVLAAFLREGKLPPNMPGLYAPAGFHLPQNPLPALGPLAKIAHGMGGHNSLLVLTPP